MPGSTEQVYSLQLQADQNDQTKVLLSYPTSDKAISMAFSTKQFPFFNLWKNPAVQEGEYMVGVGPGTNPVVNQANESAFQRASILSPKQSRSFIIDFTFHTGKSQVETVAREIEHIRAGRKTEMDVSSAAAKKVRLEDVIKAAKTWEPAYQKWYGKPAPDFALTDVADKVHRLGDYKGKNVIIIFWATWCGPCLREIPDLMELRKTVGQSELAMLAVST